MSTPLQQRLALLCGTPISLNGRTKEAALAHYEEKLYRVTKTQPPAVSDLKAQLATLKRDLAHFQSSRASNLLMDSLKERIRQIETHLAREAQAKSRPAAPRDEADTPAAVYATAARYGARPRRSP